MKDLDAFAQLARAQDVRLPETNETTQVVTAQRTTPFDGNAAGGLKPAQRPAIIRVRSKEDILNGMEARR